MDLKGGRAELAVSHQLIVAFGPPTAVASTKRGKEPRTWTLRGKIVEEKSFYLKHTPMDRMKLRVKIGNEWLELSEVIEVQHKERHIVIRCRGELE